MGPVNDRNQVFKFVPMLFDPDKTHAPLMTNNRFALRMIGICRNSRRRWVNESTEWNGPSPAHGFS